MDLLWNIGRSQEVYIILQSATRVDHPLIKLSLTGFFFLMWTASSSPTAQSLALQQSYNTVAL